MYLCLSAQADHFMKCERTFCLFFVRAFPVSRASRADLCFSTSKVGAKGYSAPLPKTWGPWSPCPPPYAAALASSNALDSVVISSDVENAQDALVSDFVPVSVPLIKHIPKSARPACANHRKELLNNIVSNCKDVSAWLAVLYWSRLFLLRPNVGTRNIISHLSFETHSII